MPEHFPSAEEFLFTFDKLVTSFNVFNDCNYHVIVEVVCSTVVQKVFCKFTATNFAFNMISMVVESQVETCLALSYKLQLANLAFDNINYPGRLTIHFMEYVAVLGSCKGSARVNSLTYPKSVSLVISILQQAF